MNLQVWAYVLRVSGFTVSARELRAAREKGRRSYAVGPEGLRFRVQV